MIFEEHRSRAKTRYDHTVWYLRRESTYTHDGLYTIGKLQRLIRWKQPPGELHLTLNGDTWLTLEETKQVVEFMEQHP